MRKRGEEGFTLIEVMIAMAVVVIALIGIGFGNSKVQQVSAESFEKARAIQHANQVVERMRNLAATSLSSVTSTFSNGGTVATSYYSTSTSELLPSESVTVSFVNTTANPLDATVTVTWSQRGIRTVSRSIRTYIAQRL